MHQTVMVNVLIVFFYPNSKLKLGWAFSIYSALWSGNTWAYLSIVTVTEECPNLSEMYFIGTFLLARFDTWECLNEWTV